MVDDGDEVVEPVAGCHVRGLPHLALLALAVAEQHEGAEVLAQVAPPPRAMPSPAERPMPSDPVEMSMPGSLFMSGWPCRRAPFLLKVNISSIGK